MTQYMKEKNTKKDSKVEFVDKTRSKNKNNKKQSKSKSKSDIPTVLPTKRPVSAFADSKIADAVKRTNKAKKEGKNFTKKNGVIQKSKKSDGVAVGRVIDPEAKIKELERRKKLREEKKKKNQMTSRQKMKDKLRNQGKSKNKTVPKATLHKAVFKTVDNLAKKLKT